MKLVELDPRWIEYEGRKVGFVFLCPHCFPKQRQWLSCFFEPFSVLNGGKEPNQYHFFEQAIPSEEEAEQAVGCNKRASWTKTSEDFGNISVMPSIDASAAGHWHGFVTNGEVK